jgi:hypothetical protein
MSSEPSATTSPELPVLVQPQVPIQDEIEVEAVITIQSFEERELENPATNQRNHATRIPKLSFVTESL